MSSKRMLTLDCLLLVLALIHKCTGQLPVCNRDSRFGVNCGSVANVDKYRTLDGTCNNKRFPSWGASGTQFLRLLPAIYEDSRDAPIGFHENVLYDGVRKPNARDVSKHLMSANFTLVNPTHTALLPHWGQLLAHDLTLGREFDRNCSQDGRDSRRCFNIELPQADKLAKFTEIFPFKRTAACYSAAGARQQINTVTSYIDASVIYGTESDLLRRLRDFTTQDGLLKVNSFYRSREGKDYPPFDERNLHQCFRDTTVDGVQCFLTGDERANEQIMLLTLHVVLFREHNRIATELKRLNPHWNGETVFQETRKIVGAIIQSISFNEWLPSIVGDTGMNLIDRYSSYKSNENPSIANAFATAVMRFGHAIMVPVIERRDANYREFASGHLPLRDAFFAPELILFDSGIDPLIRGATFSAAKEITAQSLVNSELTEHLFPHRFPFPLDLASLNVQRGRDHALPGYNDFRRYCGIGRLTSWQEMGREIRDPERIEHLRSIYTSIDNVDLWVGGLLERPISGSKLGPTFTCVLVNQFRRLRDGDRFWFENRQVFDAAQIDSIRRYSLAKVFCHNGDSIDRMQPNVFNQHSGLVPCRNLADLDLSLWQERREGVPAPAPREPETPVSQNTDSVCESEACRCVYELGQWSNCDAKGLQQRVDRLRAAEFGLAGLTCQRVRTVTQQCSPLRSTT